jgi:prophage antirepressor-like protein
MQYELQIFEYEDRDEFRTLDINGEPWFVLADVCRALGLQPKNGAYGHHADRLDHDERRAILESSLPAKGGGRIGNRTLTIVSESGLFALILRSDKPQAKRFRKWVTSEVLPAIRRTGRYVAGVGATAFIRRYNENWDRVEPGHFSVISELVWWLWGRLAHVGHVMADRAADGTELRPDVSVGRRFADWLRANHPELADTFKTYLHKTPEIEIEARQYPDNVLPLFRKVVDTIWIPEHSRDYFKTRDPQAIRYLPLLLPAPTHARTLPRPGVRVPATSLKPQRPPAA